MAEDKKSQNSSSGGLSLESVTSKKVEAAKTQGPNNEEQKAMYAAKNKQEAAGETEASGTQEIKFSVIAEVEASGPVVVEENHGEQEGHHSSQSAPVNMVGIPTEIRSQAEIMEALKLIALFSGEAKVLESEMNKIIKKIYATNPQLKPYLMKMKKLLKSHANIESILEKLPTEGSDEKKAS